MSSSKPTSICTPKRTKRVFAELTKFFAELTELAAKLSALFRNSTLETVFRPLEKDQVLSLIQWSARYPEKGGVASRGVCDHEAMKRWSESDEDDEDLSSSLLHLFLCSFILSLEGHSLTLCVSVSLAPPQRTLLGVNRRRTNVQQLTCKIDLSSSFFVFSSLLFSLS